MVLPELTVDGDLVVNGTVTSTGAMTPGSGVDVADTFTVHDPADPTKKARIDCGSVTAANTRVLTAPDYNGTIATVAGPETLTNKELTAPQITGGSHIADEDGNELLEVPAAVAGAINHVKLSNAAIGTGPVLEAVGDDANIPITLAGKGTGKVSLGQATSVGVELVATQPLLDENDKELVEFSATADAVNQLKVTNAATGLAPKLEAAGDDASACLQIGGKGAPVVPLTRLLGLHPAPTVMADASDQALTASEVIGGVILRDCSGAHRQDTFPAAIDVVAALLQPIVGSSWLLLVRNTSGGATTITLAAPGADVTLDGTFTVAQSKSRLFLIRLTNVSAGTEAYTVYSVGLLDN